jgi:hypothetical protein
VVIASENSRQESSSPSATREYSQDAMPPPPASSDGSSSSKLLIEAAVGAWGDGCPLCRAKKVGAALPHSLSGCRQRLAPSIREQQAAIQALRPSEQGSQEYCVACLLPISVCDRFRPSAKDCGPCSTIHTQCQYPSLVIQTVLSVCSYKPRAVQQILDPSMARDGSRLKDQEGSFLWFVTEKELGGLYVPNITHCFYQMYQFCTTDRRLPLSKSQARDQRRRYGSSNTS